MSEMYTSDDYGTREIHEYLLKILIDIDAFCRENDIRYSLYCGTLLGAVRHKGFIPWDDDVDIVFDRENYDKFMRIAREHFPEEYTIIGDGWLKRVTRKDNSRIGQEEKCIDLFVLDHVPDNRCVEKFKNFLLMTLQGMLKKDRHYERFSLKWKILMFVTYIMGKPFKTSTKQKWYTAVSKIGNKKETRRIRPYNILFKSLRKKAKTPSYIMDGYDDVEFCGVKLMAIRRREEYLRIYYGDYMKLPPESERRPAHLKG